MFKVETAQQFKILEFLKDNFDMQFIDLFLISRNAILIHDRQGDSAIFRLNEQNGEIDIDYDNDYIPFKEEA